MHHCSLWMHTGNAAWTVYLKKNAHSQHSIPHLSVFKALAERVGHRHLDVLKPLLTSSGVDLTDELRADRVVVTLQVRPALMHTLLCHLFSL